MFVSSVRFVCVQCIANFVLGHNMILDVVLFCCVSVAFFGFELHFLFRRFYVSVCCVSLA